MNDRRRGGPNGWVPLGLSKAPPDDTIPPHDRAGDEQDRRREAENHPWDARLPAAEPAEMQTRQPIHDGVDAAVSCVRLRERLHEIGKVRDRAGIRQVRSRDAKQEHERERPEPDRAMQVPIEPLPAGIPAERQAAAPALDTRPPDHQPSQSEHDTEQPANTIDGTPSCSSQQIVVEVDEPRDETKGRRYSVAQIFPGVGIEQPLCLFSVAQQPNISRLIEFPCPEYVGYFRPRVRAEGRFFQLIVGQAWPGSHGDNRCRSGQAIQFVPVHQDTTRGANHEDVKADAYPGPEVNLKDRLSQPDALGLPEPPLPSRQVTSPVTWVFDDKP